MKNTALINNLLSKAAKQNVNFYSLNKKNVLLYRNKII